MKIPLRTPGALMGLSKVALWALFGFLAPFLGGPTGVWGQAASVGDGCEVPSFQKFTNVALSNGSRITYFTEPVILCSGDTRISADSAVVYEATNFTQFFRNVVFEDSDSRLTASEAHYFDQERRLRAWGDVVLTDRTEGSVIEGDTVIMLRAGAGRPEDQLTVWGGRPKATLYPTRQAIQEEAAEEIPPPAEEFEPDSLAASVPDPGVMDDPEAPGLPRRLEPDSLAVVVPDSVVVEDPEAIELPLQAEPDSLEVVVPDSVVVEDPEAIEPPLQVEPDSLEAVLPDSVVVEDPEAIELPLQVEPDSLETVVPDSAVVEDLEAPELPPRIEEPAPPPQPPEERIPYEIEARRIFMEGTRYLRAEGAVTIFRDSVNAAADSVEYDQEAGALFLSQNSNLVTSDFDLSARYIRLDIPQDEIKEVLAEETSVLEGDDLKLLAPTINLFLTDGRLERLVALRDSVLDALSQEELDSRPPHPAGESLGLVQFPIQPHASAEDFLLRGDSIKVMAPGEVLEEVRAMGNAHGESMAEDTLNTESTPEIARRDWLAGNTVTAVFVPDTVDSGVVEGADLAMEIAQPPSAGGRQDEQAPADSAGYRLDHLIAAGGARSLYRMAASDSTTIEEEDNRLAIHYVVGEEITIYMIEGEVDHMEVSGATTGIHLEPIRPEERGVTGEGGTLPPAPPTVRPDTTAVLPGRGGGRR